MAPNFPVWEQGKSSRQILRASPRLAFIEISEASFGNREMDSTVCRTVASIQMRLADEVLRPGSLFPESASGK
jgi:hypothetical protein